MSDLVKRLRAGQHHAEPITLGGVAHDKRCLESADEIEMLRQGITIRDRELADKTRRLLNIAGALNDLTERTTCNLHALRLIERVFYMEGKPAEWRASKMQMIAHDALAGKSLKWAERLFARKKALDDLMAADAEFIDKEGDEK